jgi:hypothetical protein
MLPRWIKGSEVKAGMIIVGNSDYMGRERGDFYIAKVNKIKENRYALQREAFAKKGTCLDIDATYLDRDNTDDLSSEGCIWSNYSYLWVA